MEMLQPSWRGKFLNIRKDNNGKYIAMTNNKSLLYVPVIILPNAIYRLTIDLKSETGNGIVYFNIYANRKYDFPHTKLVCENSGWVTYNIELITKEFPKNLPFVFRMWREPEGSGTLLVRKIVVELTKEEVKDFKSVSEPVLISTEPVNSFVKENIKSENNIIKNQIVESKKQKRLRQRRENLLSLKKVEKHVVITEDTAKIPTIPKPLPIIVGTDDIKVSVLISLFNRIEYFSRTLETYAKQTLPKKDFEIVVLDDNSTQDILGLCRKYSKLYDIQFQYIKFDKNKSSYPVGAFTPALSNNIGIKCARGSVVVITGPESLQKEDNLEIAWNTANLGNCVYGYVYRSALEFTKILKNTNIREKSFKDLLKLDGATSDKSCNNWFWWYFLAIQKGHLFKINGVDERFMEGITGEDDNLSHRLIEYGIPLIRNKDIILIHQDHSEEDKFDGVHTFRFSKKLWNKLREKNTDLIDEWYKSKDPVANKKINWGNLNAIIERHYI